MKRTFAFFFPALLAVLLTFTACEDKDAPDKRDTVDLTATINGAQQIPANTSTGTGTFTGTYNKVTRQLQYQVNYSGVTPAPTTGGLYYFTDYNSQVGPAITTFTTTTAPISGTVQLNQAQENMLFGGMTYVNLGPIRGNIRLKDF
ncbi:CHRD domain-containing protein [Tellurirhabdus rosea]|uniref:CHRD domain-containing protein n=1 Tax=Tellurirhabdus rosea TaxID=2674997 RepID=UPI00224F0AEC|nr:CHRD domain-containing protein [Tellurirhabdus rosea]